jgi:hypothetical protein
VRRQRRSGQAAGSRHGWSAYVANPEGNTIGVFQQDAGAGAGQA